MINMNTKLYLAPLAGITDRAFREICIENGTDSVCTEMISARGIYYHDRKTEELLAFGQNEHPIGVQLFCCEPDIMTYAAKRCEELSPDFIDINMGCPMPKIVGNGDGCALMKNPLLAGKIVEAVSKAVSVPITVKFRSGWDESSINAPEFAKTLENAGASRLTVHGRTREMLYTGKADRGLIKKVKQAVTIPVIANGDIFTPEDALSMLKETGCDGLMAARGTLGNPFLFAQIKQLLSDGTYSVPDFHTKLSTCVKQITLMCEYKPERIAIPEARKHAAWYLKGLKNSAGRRNEIMRAETLEKVVEIMKKVENDQL